MEKDLLRTQLERVNAFDGMNLDAAVWNQAHDFHRSQQQFHNLGFHGAGIAMGLDVFAKSPPDRSVSITPGIPPTTATTLTGPSRSLTPGSCSSTARSSVCPATTFTVGAPSSS